MKQFDDIKGVYTNKYIFKSTKVFCKLNENFHQILNQIKSKKSFLKKHSKLFISQIDGFISYTNVTVKQACKINKISSQWYYRQKNKIECPKSKKKSCFIQQSNQLTVLEVNQIEEIVTAPENQKYNLTTLYFRTMHSKLVICGKSTFSHYAGLFRSFRKTKSKHKHNLGFRVSRPYEWLHVDITYVPTLNDGIQKLAFVKDNFSKAILHHKSTSDKGDSNFIRDLFQETFDKHCLFDAREPIHILSDGGSENKGALLEWIETIKATPQVLKLTAKTIDFPQSNSMSESTHSIFKSEYLQKEICIDKKQYLNHVEKFVEYYNNDRYPGDHHGLTSQQVLEGQIPNKKMFSEDIEQSRKDRIDYNKNEFRCSVDFCF
jgi:hypothetical protein